MLSRPAHRYVYSTRLFYKHCLILLGRMKITANITHVTLSDQRPTFIIHIRVENRIEHEQKFATSGQLLHVQKILTDESNWELMLPSKTLCERNTLRATFNS